MIERTSRYYDGPLAQTIDKTTGQYVISVFRKFPSTIQVRYISYVWKEGDNLSAISKKYGSGATFWWEIMEINPEILDPFVIIPGTILRIPYGS